MANGEYILIINNDLVLTESLDATLARGLDTRKIACPFSTIGKHKFSLPIQKKDHMIAGWCFMMKKEDWIPIDPRLDLWYGDNWIYETQNHSVFWG